MDTYLSQLLIAGHEPKVLSANREPAPYAEKVKQLLLQNRVRLLPLTRGEKVASAVALSAVHPLFALRIARVAFALFSGEDTPRARALATVNSLASAWPAFGGHTPNVVHVHSLKDGAFQVPAALARHIPVVVTFHGLEPVGVKQLSLTRARMLFSVASVVCVNTRFAAQQALAMGCPASRIKILPQGLPLEEFPHTPRPLPRDGEPLRILSVGRFHRDKGQQYSLLAAARLMRNGVNFRWDMVGVGPELNELKKMTASLGLSELVKFSVGIPRDSVKEMYRQSHILVLASVGGTDLSEHVETQGVVLQEAQASGCVPIASAVGGIPECIEHGVSGFLIPDRSHRAIASAILELSRDEKRYAGMQKAARELVESHFSADVIGREMSSMLEAVANQSLPHA